jgi:hypothetical protein
MEDCPDWSSVSPNNYQIASAAADFLSNDPQKYVEFYSALSTGNSWPNVFGEIFGISADQFYVEFQAYKQRGYVK